MEILRCVAFITILLSLRAVKQSGLLRADSERGLLHFSPMPCRSLCLRVSLTLKEQQIHVWAECQLFKYSCQYLMKLRPTLNITITEYKILSLNTYINLHLFLYLALQNFLIKKLVIYIIKQFYYISCFYNHQESL